MIFDLEQLAVIIFIDYSNTFGVHMTRNLFLFFKHNFVRITVFVEVVELFLEVLDYFGVGEAHYLSYFPKIDKFTVNKVK